MLESIQDYMDAAQRLLNMTQPQHQYAKEDNPDGGSLKAFLAKIFQHDQRL